jgi:hypothetical protein
LVHQPRISCSRASCRRYRDPGKPSFGKTMTAPFQKCIVSKTSPGLSRENAGTARAPSWKTWIRMFGTLSRGRCRETGRGSWLVVLREGVDRGACGRDWLQRGHGASAASACSPHSPRDNGSASLSAENTGQPLSSDLVALALADHAGTASPVFLRLRSTRRTS